MNNRDSARQYRQRRRIFVALIFSVFILLLVAFSFNGFFRGLGESVGITDAAPGDDAVNPAPRQ